MKVIEVATAAILDLGTGDIAAVIKAVSFRYAEMASGTYMRHLRRIFELVVPALISTGEATATLGSKTVTGDTAAKAVWTKDIVGRYIKVSTAWYEIADLDASTNIILRTNFAEDTATSASYQIVQKKNKLDKSVRQVGSFVNMNRARAITIINYDSFNEFSPNRVAAGGPSIASEIEEAPDGTRTYEFYPYDDKATLIHYSGYIDPPQLQPNDELPSSIETWAIIEGVKVNIMTRKMTQALDKGDHQTGGTWRNDYRAQQTRWEKVMQKQYRRDYASEDATVILSLGMGTVRPVGAGDVKTARQQVILFP